MPEAVLPIVIGEAQAKTVVDATIVLPEDVLLIERPNVDVEIDRCRVGNDTVFIAGRVIVNFPFKTQEAAFGGGDGNFATTGNGNGFNGNGNNSPFVGNGNLAGTGNGNGNNTFADVAGAGAGPRGRRCCPPVDCPEIITGDLRHVTAFIPFTLSAEVPGALDGDRCRILKACVSDLLIDRFGRNRDRLDVTVEVCVRVQVLREQVVDVSGTIQPQTNFVTFPSFR